MYWLYFWMDLWRLWLTPLNLFLCTMLIVWEKWRMQRFIVLIMFANITEVWTRVESLCSHTAAAIEESNSLSSGIFDFISLGSSGHVQVVGNKLLCFICLKETNRNGSCVASFLHQIAKARPLLTNWGERKKEKRKINVGQSDLNLSLLVLSCSRKLRWTYMFATMWALWHQSSMRHDFNVGEFMCPVPSIFGWVLSIFGKVLRWEKCRDNRNGQASLGFVCVWSVKEQCWTSV